ncbi:MAG TPA: calcium-binding protein, partial [Nitrospira sp.]|nr:calcium-binding protein [Nitrospira sp.]
QDRVGQGNGALTPDGQLDSTFTLSLAPGSGPRTITALTLTNDAGGVWDTSPGTGYWTLGVANDPTSPLLQQSSDSIQAVVGDGGSVTLFASDYQSQEFLAGRNFTVTATFADGTTASANANTNAISLGGPGDETVQLGRGFGQETLVNQTAAGDSDTLQFAAGINPLDLVFAQNGNDLQISLHGSSDDLTVHNWYAGGSNQVDVIQAGDGEHLLKANVDQLIQSMASFTQQTGLTWDQGIDQQPQQVQTILAANWKERSPEFCVAAMRRRMAGNFPAVF